MAVRNFGGANNHYIQVGGGQIGALLNDAFTVVVLVNVNSFNDPTPFVAIWEAARLADWGSRPNQRPQWATASGNSNGTVNTGDTAGDWHMYVVTKTDGTATPRAHWKNIQTGGSWSHANLDSSRPDVATVVTSVRFGVSDDRYLNGRLALAALYNYALTDAQVESLTATLSTMDLLNVSSDGAFPVAAWEFNQESIGEEVYDLIGGGADETARSGTTVVTDDDPPGWSFLDAGGTPIYPEFDPTGVLG